MMATISNIDKIYDVLLPKQFQQNQQAMLRKPKAISRTGKWSPEEDDLLKKLVSELGEKQWRRISQSISGRSALQCLHRWSKILKPGLIKGPWLPEEDQKLKEWVNKNGPQKWPQAASFIQGRSGKQCRERWHNALDPEIKKGNWSDEEDKKIYELYQKYGSSWSKISKKLPGRTENSIKNRFYSTIRKIETETKKILKSGKNYQKLKEKEEIQIKKDEEKHMLYELLKKKHSVQNNIKYKNECCININPLNKADIFLRNFDKLKDENGYINCAPLKNFINLFNDQTFQNYSPVYSTLIMSSNSLNNTILRPSIHYDLSNYNQSLVNIHSIFNQHPIQANNYNLNIQNHNSISLIQQAFFDIQRLKNIFDAKEKATKLEEEKLYNKHDNQLTIENIPFSKYAKVKKSMPDSPNSEANSEFSTNSSRSSINIMAIQKKLKTFQIATKKKKESKFNMKIIFTCNSSTSISLYFIYPNFYLHT